MMLKRSLTDCTNGQSEERRLAVQLISLPLGVNMPAKIRLHVKNISIFIPVVAFTLILANETESSQDDLYQPTISSLCKSIKIIIISI